MFPVSRDGAD
jgi:ribosome-interacting GTPase 1